MSILAIVENHGFRKNSLRRSLDALGHASIGFECLADFSEAVLRNQQIDLLIHSVEGSEMQNPSIIRAKSEIPTLFLMSDECWKLLPAIKDFKQEGKTDCLRSSFNIKELEYRIRSLIFQNSLHAGENAEVDFFQHGAYHIEVKNRVIRLQGTLIRLKPRELDVALLFFRNEGRILSRNQIWRSVAGKDFSKGSRSLDVCICNVRKKLQIGAENGVTLRMIYGEGYQLICERVAETSVEKYSVEAGSDYLDVRAE